MSGVFFNSHRRFDFVAAAHKLESMLELMQPSQVADFIMQKNH
jgi:hypothetical protein